MKERFFSTCTKSVPKRKAVKNYYSDFVNELKHTDPGKWYAMAKQIGAVDQMTSGDIQVESLIGFDNVQSAQMIDDHFAKTSIEYEPIDNSHSCFIYLPCHHPRSLSRMCILD